MAPCNEELEIRFYRLENDKVGVPDHYVTICNGLGFIYEREEGYWRLRSIGQYHLNELRFDRFKHWHEVTALEVLLVTGLGKDYVRLRRREMRRAYPIKECEHINE